MKRFLILIKLICLIACVLVLVIPSQALQAYWITLTINSPFKVGGASGSQDERDLDFFPNVAYNPTLKQFLVVWQSARNAGSSSANFDLYGKFLDHNGLPIGGDFRISDTNSVARSSQPGIAAGKDGFFVTWTASQSEKCQIMGQWVANTNAITDQTLISSAVHIHSPAVTYNDSTGMFDMVYVYGDDYLPSRLFGNNMATCGDNPNSTSQTRVAEFAVNQGVFVQNYDTAASNPAGTFRPKIAYNAVRQKILTIWEDRRSAGGTAPVLGVVGQQFDKSLKTVGQNIIFASATDYSTEDTSSNWTPRPDVAAGNSIFFVAWFQKEMLQTTKRYKIIASTINQNDVVSTGVVTNLYDFMEPHPTEAPTGYINIGFSTLTNELSVGVSVFTESIRGYYSNTRFQRVNANLQPLGTNGLPKSPDFGMLVDLQIENQMGVGIAESDVSIIAFYSKHLSSDPMEKNLDIWGNVLWTALTKRTYLPAVKH